MAEMTSINRGFNDPQLIHINLKVDPPVVEELNRRIQEHIVVPVKKGWAQANFREACMSGAPHPLSIEREMWTLVTIHTGSMDASTHDLADGHYTHNQFSELEIDFINSVQRRPEIEWAIDNSFDGVYVQRYEDFARFATSFKFGVYMKDEQVTFWKLKYSGK